MNVSTILGGVAGGLAGALVWVLVGYFTGYEVGYIAWGVGFLAGAGLRYFAWKSDIEESVAQGIAAAIIAIGCILVGKLGVAYLLVEKEKQDIAAEFDNASFDDDTMIAAEAHQIVAARNREGRPVPRPKLDILLDGDPKNDFPKDIWDEAARKWRQMSDAERAAAIEKEKEATRQQAEARVPDAMSVFKGSFAPWDLLWAFLAVGTAYKIGVGTYSNE